MVGEGAKVAMEVFMPQEYWTLAGEMKAAAAGGGGQQDGSCVAKLVQVGAFGGGGGAQGREMKMGGW